MHESRSGDPRPVTACQGPTRAGNHPPASAARCPSPLRPLVLVAALTGLVAAGCSSFSREWKAAERPPSDPAGIAGRWIGTWQNTNNTHSDVMRAVLTPVSPTEYRAHFHAKYKKVISFRYSATFHGAVQDGLFQFNGAEDLGKMAGGVYRYEGRIGPTNFFSTYQSKYDSGTFTLHRP